MPIPLLDLQAQFEEIRDEVMPAVISVIESQRFIMGEQVGRLEEAVGRLSGTEFAVACASGTDALLLPLKTLDLASSDEVITTPFTFFATAGAIANAGGTPVFVDIDPATFNIDPAAVDAAITPRTRAIIPVHLFGQMAPMQQLLALSARHGAVVIEDAAQAIGARQRNDGGWQLAGGTGWAGAFSFFPSKNLGGWGDGGMTVTDDADLAGRLRLLRVHGGAKQYHHEEIGTNSRLDTLQAAVLLAKVGHLAEWAVGRRRHAAAYDEAFESLDAVAAPPVAVDNEHVYHQYTIRADHRDELRDHLKGKGIGCAVYYPTPLHLQPCFAELRKRGGEFPESERASREVLSLPIYPELQSSQRDTIIEAIRGFYQ
ncbi:MAG: DegT/DnrJ/EryC1/StrS family aminotransferase [Gemmatimonadetes bacterium]|nr:DegT/DnrJ/EryC1/StrS family aminotransferase [Gemmatimonadota bacterium]